MGSISRGGVHSGYLLVSRADGWSDRRRRDGNRESESEGGRRKRESEGGRVGVGGRDRKRPVEGAMLKAGAVAGGVVILGAIGGLVYLSTRQGKKR